MTQATMFISQLIWFLFYLKPQSSLSQECSLGKNEIQKIQMVFVVDGALSPKSKFVNIQREYSKLFMARISKMQPNAEFGVVAYYSWQGKKGNCYKLLQNFTKNQNDVSKQIANLPGEAGDSLVRSKCSVSMALIMTIADKNLAWESNLDLVSTKSLTRKFVVTYPLKIPISDLKNSDGRRDPIGDGSDTCENSNPPSGDFISHMYWRGNFYLLYSLWHVHGTGEVVSDSYWYDPLNLGFMLYNGILCQQDVYKESLKASGLSFVTSSMNREGRDASRKEQRKLGGWTEQDFQLNKVPTSFEDFFSICQPDFLNKCKWEVEEGYNTLGL